jgi:hypothetical protein
MEAAGRVVELASPFIAYVIPTLAIVSFIILAESFFGFLALIIDWLRKRKINL